MRVGGSPEASPGSHTRSGCRLPCGIGVRYLTRIVDESPDDADLMDGYVYLEIRGGYAKWAHFRCPRCGERIQISVAGPGGSTQPAERLRFTVHPPAANKRLLGAPLRSGNQRGSLEAPSSRGTAPSARGELAR